MLEKIEVRSVQGAVLTFPLEEPSGYLIEDIEGLDPVNANIVSSTFANLDGEQYQSARREKRNIIFKMNLDPDYETESVRDLRTRLYNFMMPKSEVSLRFYQDDAPTVDIVGRVESFVAPLFAKVPKATISLLCMDSDFYVPEPVILAGTTTPNLDASLPGAMSFDYEGSIDSGLLLTVNVNRSVASFVVYIRSEEGAVQSLTFAAPLLAGDVLRISTNPGNKYATVTRAGVQSPILYGISPYSEWVKVTPGINIMRIVLAGAAVPFTIEYNDKFGGL